MRGKVEFNRGNHALCRITPAYAGKSSALFESIRVPQDHPRLCGEKQSNSQ